MRSGPTFETDDDPARVDGDAVWRLLSEHAYWGRWRGRPDFDRQLAGAWRVVGAYDVASGALVGFARAISDGASIAYLADVIVDPAVRGQGIGQAIVAHLIEHGPGADFRWLLHTADAHGLYERFGFRPPDSTVLERPAAHRRSAGGPGQRDGGA